MIYYVLIVLSVVCFSAQFAFTKLYERSAKQKTVTSLAMLIVMALVGAALFLCIGKFQIRFSVHSLTWATVMAGLMLPYYIVGIKVLSLGSLAVYSTFMMLGGMLVPFFYGIVFLHESVSTGKILGCVLLTACIVMQAYIQNAQTRSNTDRSDGKNKTLLFVLCLVIFFVNGMTGVVAKAHQLNAAAVDTVSFTALYCLLTALFSALLLCVILLTGQRKEKCAQLKKILGWRTLLTVAAIGLAAYTGNFLSFTATSHIPASVQFPIVSGGTIVLSAIVSAFIFKEKISKKEWLSVVGAFIATFLFAF